MNAIRKKKKHKSKELFFIDIDKMHANTITYPKYWELIKVRNIEIHMNQNKKNFQQKEK